MKRRVICFVSVIAFLFASCEMFQEPVKEYLEYWTSTIQVVSQEIVSPYIRIGGVDNVSAEKNIFELYIYLINPNKIEFESKFQLQCINSNLTNFKQEIISSDTVKITAALDDSQEGKEITLSGYIKPSNKNDYGKDQLKELNPELFYEKTFIQNTPPDAAANFTESTNKINGRFYTIFDIPNQSLNKNKDIKYKIQTYKRDTGTHQLTLIDEEIVSSSDNKNTSNNGKFYYYSDKQEENLGYEYSVTVLGKLNLTSDKKSTDPGLGNCPVNDPEFTVDNSTEDSEVHSGYDTYTLNTKGADSTNFIINSKTGISYKIKLDNGAYQSTDSISIPVGRHIVTIVSEKDRCETNIYEKKLFIQGQLKDPEITYQNGCDDGTENKDGKTYEKMQFSYIKYDELQVEFANLNGNGSTMRIEVNNKDPLDIQNDSTLLFDPDEYEDITITQTKENYKTLVSKKYIKPVIKPITLKFENNGSDIKIKTINFQINGSLYEFRGNIKIDSEQIFGDWSKNATNSLSSRTIQDGVWYYIKDNRKGSISNNYTSLSDKTKLEIKQFRRYIKNSDSDNDFDPDKWISQERTLSQIKKAYNTMELTDLPDWTFVAETYTYGSMTVQLWVKFTPSEED